MRQEESSEGAVHVSRELPQFRGSDRFETGPRIGSGGMGEVVLQMDRNIGRAVAKKMLHPHVDRPVSIQRFIREARVQGQLEHPAVVPVHDFGLDAEGRLFFSMKLIRGRTLGDILNGLSNKSPAVVLSFSRHKLLSAFVQVCLAVEYAHKRGVIHRDLKPNNVMLGDFGEVYVLDWGLAKLTRLPESEDAEATAPKDTASSESPEMTSDGDLLGTPLYMAPEQLKGKHAILDERADVFALGVLLFEILTLEPFRRGSALTIMVGEEKSTSPERPSRRVADVPAELDDLCASALVRDPAGRLGSARALADGVERYLEGDRDLVARRARAAELLQSARIRSTGAAPDSVTATREVLEALALAPGDLEAQRMLVTLVLESSSALSPEASRAYADRDAEVRAQGLRRGIVAYLLWLCTLPAALYVGVRDYPVLVSLVVITLTCIVASALALRTKTGPRSRAFALVLTGASALVVALGSAYLGPFVLTPIATCAASTMFLIHGTREEAPAIIAIWLLAVVAMFGVEWLHVVPAAYTFRGGDLVLHARMLNLPEVPTVLFLAYSTLSFVGVLGYFVAQLRGKQREAERQLFGQAWLLQQLFPAPEEGPRR
jgi:serine/threonine protein kinase